MDKNNIYKNAENYYGGKLNSDAIKQAAKSGNTDALINNLSEQDKKKLYSILNDKQAFQQVLSSPQAAALLKLFSGGDKNG